MGTVRERPETVTLTDVAAAVAALNDHAGAMQAGTDAELDRLEAAVTRLEERRGVTS